MRIICAKDYDEVSKYAANIIAGQINLKPDAVLGLATGGSPVGTYARLVELFQNNDVDFSQVTSVNLDEYRGLSGSDRESYWSFMQEHLFRHVNIRKENIHIPSGENLNSDEVCREYDEMISKIGRIDLQLLGIGLDGHIGFNEPGESFELNTHCVNLTESTLEANKRFFGSREQVPGQAYTMGIRPIMQARKVLMLASGRNKADILKEAFTGHVTPRIPASVLQLHPDFVLIADEEALAGLEK